MGWKSESRRVGILARDASNPSWKELCWRKERSDPSRCQIGSQKPLSICAMFVGNRFIRAECNGLVRRCNTVVGMDVANHKLVTTDIKTKLREKQVQRVLVSIDLVREQSCIRNNNGFHRNGFGEFNNRRWSRATNLCESLLVVERLVNFSQIGL